MRTTARWQKGANSKNARNQHASFRLGPSDEPHSIHVEPSSPLLLPKVRPAAYSDCISLLRVRWRRGVLLLRRVDTCTAQISALRQAATWRVCQVLPRSSSETVTPVPHTRAQSDPCHPGRRRCRKQYGSTATLPRFSKPVPESVEENTPATLRTGEPEHGILTGIARCAYAETGGPGPPPGISRVLGAPDTVFAASRHAAA